MCDIPSVGAFAIVPSNDLPGAIPFWERLGFARTGGDDNYFIMTGWGCEVHLIQAGSGPWAVPEEHNPFGVFIRTPEVDAIATRVEDLVIRPGGVLRHREWGLGRDLRAGRRAHPDRMAVSLDPARVLRPVSINQSLNVSGSFGERSRPAHLRFLPKLEKLRSVVYKKDRASCRAWL